MSIDEMNGMIRGYKQIKDFCKGGNLAFDGKDSDVHEGAKIVLNNLVSLCDDNISQIQENIDGEIERMYQMMEHNKAMKDSEMIEWQKENLKTTGGQDDRQDKRDL